MVARKLDARRRVVNPRLSTFRPYLLGAPGGCAPAGSLLAAEGAGDLATAPDPVLSFEAAFAALQVELPVVGEAGVVPEAAGRKSYTYALWEDINEAIRPLLARHGFSLRFRVAQEPQRITVTAALIHALGHREETSLTLPVDPSGGKNGVQAIGSSVSYGKRYTAALLLNITTRGDDDDGRAAGAPSLVTAEQVASLRDLLKSSRRSEARFLTYLKLERLEDLPQSRFNAACETLRARGGRS